MKAVIRTSVVFLLLFTGRCFAQPSWELVGPVEFKAIQPAAGGKLVACTNAGSIYWTTDNGDTWAHRLLNPGRNFTSLKFCDSLHGMMGATPDFGYIEITTDGGNTWREKNIGTGFTQSIAYPSLDTAYACLYPHSIFRTTDGGEHWDSLSIINGPRLRKLAFSSARTGYAVGDSGLMLRTTDAGASWTRISLPSVVEVISTIDVNRADNIVIGTLGFQIGYSPDGGMNWSLTNFSTVDSLRLAVQQVKMVGDTLLAFQNAGDYRLVSTDHGLHWKPVLINPEAFAPKPSVYYSRDAQYFDSYLNSKGEGLAVGSWGTIYHLKDYGLGSPSQPSFLQHQCAIGIATFPFTKSDGFLLIEAANGDLSVLHAVDASDGPLSTTTDGGSSWFSRYTSDLSHPRFTGLHFSSATTGTLYSPYFANGQDRLLSIKTSDNGVSWSGPHIFPPGKYWGNITAPDGSIYFLQDSAVYRSADDGETVQLYSKYFETTPKDDKRKILTSSISLGFVFDSQTMLVEVTTSDSMFKYTSGFGFTHGVSYNIVSTTDGGAHWTKQYVFPDTVYLSMLHFVSKDVGMAVMTDTSGKNVYAWRTINGGQSWENIPQLKTSKVFQDLKFNSSGTLGIALGTSGDMYYSRDSGRTWIADSLIYAVPFSLLNARSTKVVFLNDSTPLIVSDVGFWKKVIPNHPQSDVSSFTTSNPYLYIKYYPSPVRGEVVHLEVYGLYSVSDAERCTLVLYDLLGRKVLDLSTELTQHSNGSYSFFDVSASQLPAGVYTLVLTTPNGGKSTTILSCDH